MAQKEKMPKFHFVITRNSEQEKFVVSAPTDDQAWQRLTSTCAMEGVEKIVLATTAGG